MAKRMGRIGTAATLLGLLLPLPAWAGSAQATLSVAVVVPARCAVRVQGSMGPQEMVGAAHEAVSMRCTKGSLPTSAGAAGPSAVGPRISRDLVTASPLPTAAPRPQADTGATTVTEAAGPRMVVTVNF